MDFRKFSIKTKRISKDEKEIGISLNAYREGKIVSKTGLDVEVCNTIFFTDTCHSFQYNNIYSLEELKVLTSIPKYRVSPKIKDVSYMFGNCRSVESIDTSAFYGIQPKDMTGMFFFCQNLKYLDLTGIDFSQVTSYRVMFHSCTSLQRIDGVFDLSNIKSNDDLENLNNMFKKCPSTLKVKLRNIPSNFYTAIKPKRTSDFGNVVAMPCSQRMGLKPEQIEIVE